MEEDGAEAGVVRRGDKEVAGGVVCAGGELGDVEGCEEGYVSRGDDRVWEEKERG